MITPETSSELDLEESQPILQRSQQVFSASTRLKITIICSVSLINGALYFAIAMAGGENIERLFKITGNAANRAMFATSVGAGLVYTMFTYKTLEFLSLRINSAPKAIFSFFGPFSALAFLTGGIEGSSLLGLGYNTALGIGFSLFGLRIINATDASVKFPERISETKQAWNKAKHEHDYKEFVRLLVIGTGSVGYALSSTDAIYSATQTILKWFSASPSVNEGISYTSSILGAIGTLPLVFYWGHRGLRQLTFGGKENGQGQNPDPTDRYTYIALLLVFPVVLGILGSATASTGAVFGQLGTFSEVVRVTSSVLYAVCAGTPGMATLLRNTVASLKKLKCCNKEINRTSLGIENQELIPSIRGQEQFGFFQRNRTRKAYEEITEKSPPKNRREFSCSSKCTML